MTSTRKMRLMHTVAALLAATVVLPQWHFRLDTSFRTNIVEKNVNYMHFLEDGRIFLSGRVKFPGDWMLSTERGGSCILTNGQQDMDFPHFPQTAGGGAIVPWINGSFYVDAALPRRLGPDGLIDPTFAPLHTSPYFSPFFVGGYHVYPEDGRVLISGLHTLSDTARGHVGMYNLVWFSNEGYLDTTRLHRSGSSPAGYCTVHRFSELPNGQFICTSNCNEFEGKEVDWIFRVNADGTPDTTFRTGVYIGNARAYLPLEDGRVYVGGNFRRTEAPNDTLRLVRFMPDGSLDPTFSIPQFTMGGQGITAPHGAYVHRIFPWKPGYLLVAGHFRHVNGEPRSSICMIDTTGQMQPAFAGNWMGTFTDGSVTGSSIIDILPNSDTTAIYICGAYTGYGDGVITDPTQRFVSRLLVEEDTGTTSVQEVPPKTPALQLYPNPANGLVSMRYHLPGNTGAALMVVRDVHGRTVQQFNVRGMQGEHAWDVQGLVPGVYMVELRCEGRLEGTQRLVVQPR
jgi:hypothetical protein